MNVRPLSAASAAALSSTSRSETDARRDSGRRQARTLGGNLLGLPTEVMLFSGMALGYMDESAPIDSLCTERATLDQFATLHGF